MMLQTKSHKCSWKRVVTREGPEPAEGALGEEVRLRASSGIWLGSGRLSGGLRASWHGN